MRLLVSLALGAGLWASPGAAEDAARETSCEHYLRIAAGLDIAPKSGDPEIDKAFSELVAKVDAYCAANPEAKIKDVMRKAALGLL